MSTDKKNRFNNSLKLFKNLQFFFIKKKTVLKKSVQILHVNKFLSISCWIQYIPAVFGSNAIFRLVLWQTKSCKHSQIMFMQQDAEIDFLEKI